VLRPVNGPSSGVRDHGVDRRASSLRRLLAQPGSYSIIAAAVASGGLRELPVTLLDHVGDVYRRVETAADPDDERIEALRLAALVHEEPLDRVRQLVGSPGLSELLPEVVAVIREFGRVWKVSTDGDLRGYVDENRRFLRAILLFELAHEGRATSQMERAARAGRLATAFARWAARLVRTAPPGATRRRARRGRPAPSSGRGGRRPRS
jgi:hypothetical protein